MTGGSAEEICDRQTNNTAEKRKPVTGTEGCLVA